MDKTIVSQSVLSVVAIVLASCGGRQGAAVIGDAKQRHPQAKQTTTSPTIDSKPKRPERMQSSQPSPGPYIDEEIVPLLDPIPRPITDANHLSEDPSDIREEVSRLLADGNRSDALPLIDVLLILNPMDLEMLETRGRILVSQGFDEDGTLDLTRCCEKGRQSCCQ